MAELLDDAEEGSSCIQDIIKNLVPSKNPTKSQAALVEANKKLCGVATLQHNEPEGTFYLLLTISYIFILN